MKLYTCLKQDMIEAYKAGYTETTDTLKTLISDIQRDPNKDYSDDKVLLVIKQTIKLAKEAIQNGDKQAVCTVTLLQNYLPKQVSEKEIKDVIRSIDFSKLKNKMQAVGIIIKHFPKGTVDGKVVRKLIESM